VDDPRAAAPGTESPALLAKGAAAPGGTADRGDANWLLMLGAFAGLGVLALLVAAGLARRTSGRRRQLSPRERQEALLKLRGWLAEDEAAEAFTGARR
jgi:hypothetical protein